MTQPGVACILPPHLLTEIARRAGGEQRDAAIKALGVDHSLRSLRVHQAATLAATGTRHQTLPRAAGQQPVKQRTIYDSKHRDSEPPTGTVMRREGDAATGDLEVDEAYDGLGATFDLYLDVYDRNSLDDDGSPLNGYVHFGENYPNAFYDGKEMVFGDGVPGLFNRFTIDVDVIGHELTHGVTADEAQLVYRGQPGALNESLSDVFGSLVKQYLHRQTADAADWLIGEGLLADGVSGRALRDMANPGTAYDDPKQLGKDPQPAHMSGYVTTADDNGGVHINSGIPNRAFYLAAVGLGGYAWEKAGKIWYDTLRDPRLKASARFTSFANITVAVATRDFGANAAQTVQDAWRQVGVLS